MTSTPHDPASTGPSGEPAASSPVPRPGPVSPRPGPQVAPQVASQAGGRPVPRPAPPPRPPASAPERERWGRVADDGTVYVRTADGERAVGQWPGEDAATVLAHFERKFDDLAFEVALLEQRVRAGSLAPDDAVASVKQVRALVTDAPVVGDLASLESRLDELTGEIARQREQRRAERARRLEQAKADKQRIAGEAEALAAGNDWRGGADRLRQLLEEWKGLPRLDKSLDDALWRRFSSARTTYTRRRKAHFAELNERREGARAVKERLAAEAEGLASSTDWAATASAYRDLMRRWKAAGPAPKGVDDRLWKRFRGAQDSFFSARDAQTAAQDAEMSANATVKEGLLAEAERLVPVTDLSSAKAAFRDIADRWDAAGKVPRERTRDLEGRLRAVERTIREVEEDAWRRSNPEARARAAATVSQLEASIDDLRAKQERAAAAGDTAKAAEHAHAIDARQAWLTEARRALDDFS